MCGPGPCPPTGSWVLPHVEARKAWLHGGKNFLRYQLNLSKRQYNTFFGTEWFYTQGLTQGLRSYCAFCRQECYGHPDHGCSAAAYSFLVMRITGQVIKKDEAWNPMIARVDALVTEMMETQVPPYAWGGVLDYVLREEGLRPSDAPPLIVFDLENATASFVQTMTGLLPP